jgi:hypothetical protein
MKKTKTALICLSLLTSINLFANTPKATCQMSINNPVTEKALLGPNVDGIEFNVDLDDYIRMEDLKADIFTGSLAFRDQLGRKIEVHVGDVTNDALPSFGLPANRETSVTIMVNPDRNPSFSSFSFSAEKGKGTIAASYVQNGYVWNVGCQLN